MTQYTMNKDNVTSVPVHCMHCKMLHSGLCETLTPQEMTQFNAMASSKKYSANQMIRIEDEPITFYANVISGVAKMVKSTSDGRQQIVGLILPSDFIDRVFVDIATCSIEAITDVEVCRYPKKPFEAMIRNDPHLGHNLLTLALRDLEMAEEWMLLLGRKTAREKVASFLLMLARRTPRLLCPHMDLENNPALAASELTDIPMTRADIADYLGLTMETVCRQMTHLKKDGVIDLPDNHCFINLDINRLKVEAGQEPLLDI